MQQQLILMMVMLIMIVMVMSTCEYLRKRLSLESAYSPGELDAQGSMDIGKMGCSRACPAIVDTGANGFPWKMGC